MDLVEIGQWVQTLFKQRQHGCNFFLMELRNISGMYCLSVKITYFLAFCGRRTAIPNHRSQLWMHHVLSGRAGKAGTRIWFHARVSILSRPQTLSSSVVLLWLLHFPFTPLRQLTTTCFLCLSLNFSYLLVLTSFYSCLYLSVLLFLFLEQCVSVRLD